MIDISMIAYAVGLVILFTIIWAIDSATILKIISSIVIFGQFGLILYYVKRLCEAEA